MNILELNIKGLMLLTQEKFEDNRGSFVEKFNKKRLDQLLGYSIDFNQDNEVASNFGVLRGMHYQLPPFAQTKLIRVIKGEILDVVVDCRIDSSTFGHYYSIKLTDKTNSQLLIPKGLAHGYLSLSDECIVEFKVDSKYSLECIQGFRYDDDLLKNIWNFDFKDITVSDADKKLGSFRELIYFKNEF